MSDLNNTFSKHDYDSMVTDFLSACKIEDISPNDLCAVFYTDGGSRVIGSTNYGGWGIHGYVYADVPTKSTSGCSGVTPTKNGYAVGNKDHSQNAYVVGYLDYLGMIEKDSTNNIAELMGMLRCLSLIRTLKPKHSIIKADSKYVLRLIESRETYKQNGYKTSAGKELANQELCMTLVELFDEVAENHSLEVAWVKGHNGDYGNEMADRNATKGCYGAINKLNNVTIKTDDDIADAYLLNGDMFIFATPKDYFNDTNEAPKMLSENSLFFTTNGIDTRNNNTYFQASFGKMLNGKDKAEKRKLRGKPFADCCVSVIELNKPDPLINNLITVVADTFPNSGVIECNLSYQTRKSVYCDLLSGGLNTVRVDVNKGMMLLANGEEIATLSNPVRQTFRLIRDFNAVHQFLETYIKHGNLEVDSITDITHYLYEQTESKSKTVYKMIDYDKGYVPVEVSFTINDVTKSTSIPITIGIDTPSRMSLGRMKTIKPTVKLVTWDTTERTLRFAVVIETTEGVGVWMGIYSNIHLY